MGDPFRAQKKYYNETKEDIKMFGIGIKESLLMIPMGLLGTAIPIVLIIFIILIYVKINRIEKMLADKLLQ